MAADPIAIATAPPTAEPPSVPVPAAAGQPWQGELRLQFARQGERTRHQGGASAPLKLQRAFAQSSGHCELPILHTAGGLVGGDQLRISANLAAGSRALLTSVAAQKVYGSVARSRRRPEGSWARQELAFQLAEGSDLEWLPQELVLYADGLYEQRARVDLASGASLLIAEVVRLGRTAAGERLGAGRWRSALEIRREDPEGPRWELVDRLELGGDALQEAHGLGGDPVFGSLVWLAPQPLAADALAQLLTDCRAERRGLEGRMAIGALEQGIVARYLGGSSQAARHWFTRIWRHTRAERGLAAPELPRVWPFQEQPFAEPISASLPAPAGSP
jgi:urease accessory protein